MRHRKSGRKLNRNSSHRKAMFKNMCISLSELFLTLSADDSHIIRWYGDTSFAVHQDMKSHMGGVMTMGSGGVVNDLSLLPKKQE